MCQGTFFNCALPGGEVAGCEAVEVTGVEVRAQAVEDEHGAGVCAGGGIVSVGGGCYFSVYGVLSLFQGFYERCAAAVDVVVVS